MEVVMGTQSREEQLVAELLRAQYVWNNFVHNLCHGLYPERFPGSAHGQFEGTSEDRMFQIFKIMDHEVRHVGKALQDLGFDVPQLPENHKKIFEQLSLATGITENGHSD